MDLAQTHRRRCRCLPNSCRGGTVSRQQIHPPRTVRTKGSLSPTTAKLMVFKLVIAASRTWRRLKGTNQLPKLIAGVRFNDGIEVIQVPANHAA
jgi:hypothetical protein